MACERCNNSNNRRSRRALILAIILTFDLVALALADPADPSHYQYSSSLADDLTDIEFQLQSHPESLHTLDRRRRAMPVEPDAPTPHQQPPPKPQQQQGEVITPKSNASSAVSYATNEQSGTTHSTVFVLSSTPSSVNATNTPMAGAAAAAAAGNKSTAASVKPVVVSTPINPGDKNATAKVNSTLPAPPSIDKSKVHVWANQTMWSNVTHGGDSPSEADFDDFSLGKYPAEVTNKTLHDNNVTKSEEDNHQYYNSTFSVDQEIGKAYWIDLDNHPNLQVNTLLSKSHRRAATIKLKFDFPFYGHKVRNITIATGGFLYTGEYVHSWLAATQYIAPLMANFDTTLSERSYVKYADNGTAFTVEWENVKLQDKQDAGEFTFQVTLKQNGDIIFVYAAIPVLVESIEDKEHPVKIGLSDAYMMDKTVFFARRKTIYEYHRVNFNRQDIKNWTAIYLKALPTCLQMDNCNDCLTKIKDFDCKWCPELEKCSTGTFRFRQDWLQKGCDRNNIKEEGKCPARSSTAYHEHVDSRSENHHTDDAPEVTKYSSNQQAIGIASSSLEHTQDNMSMGVSGIIGILFVITLIAGLAAWAAYAYRNPHSASGQMLIRYRPSQWSWRRGEARYTAATIHM